MNIVTKYQLYGFRFRYQSPKPSLASRLTYKHLLSGRCPLLVKRSLATVIMSDKLHDIIERSKRVASNTAVDEMIKSGQIVGIGSGTTVVYAVERIAERVRNGTLTDIRCIPTSYQAKGLIDQYKLPFTDLDNHPEPDVAVDGLDEFDPDLTMLKGGGACLTREKIIASCAKIVVGIADFRKETERLGTFHTKGIPVEVIPVAHVPVSRRIVSQFGGRCELRMASKKVGPIVTDNGNFIVDWLFPGAPGADPGTPTPDLSITPDWAGVDRGITMISGVVETGLCVAMATHIFVGARDGTCYVRRRNS